MKFARNHMRIMGNLVLRSYETKYKLFGSDGRQCVRRPVGTRYNFKYQKPISKHGGGNIIYRFVYKNILENHMPPLAENNLSVVWKFQQNNDSKHIQACKKLIFGSGGECSTSTH